MRQLGTWNADYDTTTLPEGVTRLRGYSLDAVDNRGEDSGRDWDVKIDRSAPDVALSGSLKERENDSLDEDAYHLKVEATDGDAANPRSGAKSIEILVDGERRDYVEQPCAAGSCSLSHDFVFRTKEYAPGEQHDQGHRQRPGRKLPRPRVGCEGRPKGCRSVDGRAHRNRRHQLRACDLGRRALRGLLLLCVQPRARGHQRGRGTSSSATLGPRPPGGFPSTPTAWGQRRKLRPRDLVRRALCGLPLARLEPRRRGHQRRRRHLRPRPDGRHHLPGLRGLGGRPGQRRKLQPRDHLRRALRGPPLARLEPRAGDTHAASDISVRDRTAGTTTRVSLSQDGDQADAGSYSPSISGDGQKVAYRSDAALADADSNGQSDVYLADQSAGTTALVSWPPHTGGSYSPSISGDGRYVAYASDSPRSSEDVNGVRDIYEFDVAEGRTVARLSYDDVRGEGNGPSDAPSLPRTPSAAPFASEASNFAVDTNGAQDVYLHEWVTSAELMSGDSQTSSALSTASLEPSGRPPAVPPEVGTS